MGMVDLKDKKNLDIGLWQLSDWLKYNTESAWRNEHRLLSDHDYNYYQEVIKEARDYLTEDDNEDEVITQGDKKLKDYLERQEFFNDTERN